MVGKGTSKCGLSSDAADGELGLGCPGLGIEPPLFGSSLLLYCRFMDMRTGEKMEKKF